jgi:hypothetical protein
MYYLFILFFIIIIIIIILWIIVLKSPPTNSNLPTITYSLASYGGICSPDDVVVESINVPYKYIPQHCSDGLICVNYSNTSICKVKKGFFCNNLNECEPGCIECSGVCI